MLICSNCNRVTIGEPLFCNFCGRSFDVKLCPRLHPNPRTAEVCAQCGSRDLSLPAPRRGFWNRLSQFTTATLPGLVLLLVSIALGMALIESLTRPEILVRLLPLLLMLGILWWIYVRLPLFVRRGIGSAWKRVRRRRGPNTR